MIPLLLVLIAVDSPEPVDGDDAGEATEETFLAPYYEADSAEAGEDEGCSTFDGCWETFDLFRILGAIEVRHHPDPFRYDGVRSQLGEEGAPFGLHASLGIARLDDGRGVVVGARLLTPCPAGVHLLYQTVDGEGGEAFSLLYAGVPFELSFGSPLQLSVGPEAVFPREEGRHALAGYGLGLEAGFLFLDAGAASLDWRLAWVNGLPLQRGEARLSWFVLPAELWAGFGFLRNASGGVLSGPSAGVGLLL